MSSIDRYLGVVFGRDCRDRVSAMLRSNYIDTHNGAWRYYRNIARHAGELAGGLVVDRLGNAPALQVVHSIHSRPQIAHFTGHEVLIYDQHLGQILSMLTRLVSEDAHISRVEAYLYKLLGQRCYVAGRYDRAAIFALIANEELRFAQSEGHLKPATNTHERLRSVFFQERFVIAHELAHVVLMRSPLLKEVCNNMYRTAARDHFDRFWAPPDVLKAAEKLFLQEFRAAWLRISPDTEPNFYPVPSLVDRPHTSEFVELLDRDDDLMTEFVCDSLAATYLLEVFGRSPDGYRLAFLYSSMALQNLRIVQRLDAEALSTDDPMAHGKWIDFRASMGRYSLLRAVSNSMADRFLDDTQRRHIHQCLTDWNERLQRVIGDHLDFFFAPSGIEASVRLDPSDEARAMCSAVVPLSEDIPELLYMLGF